MPIPTHIGPRERQILTAIVETYISTGEPVGSRTISRTNKDGLSAATIRNVMAELAESGYLEQPHTSAGRVPTPEAYRYYVEHITGKAKISPEAQDRIADSFRGVGDVQEFLERTSHVLSLVSSGVGVAVATSAGKRNTLQHVYFSRQGAQKVLAVVVTSGGVVRDRVLKMERELSQAELESAANYINESFRGWTIEAMQQQLLRNIEKERHEYDRLMQSLEDLSKAGALADTPTHSVYVEGVANLVGTEGDKQRLSEMLRTLEERQKVADILSAYLDARQEAVRVVIGLEETMPQMKNLVLIGAPARVGGEVMGSLAVIGPTRMDYEHTITAVSYIAQLFDKILNEKD